MTGPRDQDEFVSLEEWDHPIDPTTEEPIEDNEILGERERFKELNFDPELVEQARRMEIPTDFEDHDDDDFNDYY